MELRAYWRVLVRRGRVIRNTFLIVAVLALLTVAYSYYGAFYQGHAKINVQVQPPSSTKQVIYDVQQAAQQLSGQAVTEITNFGADTVYFKNVSREVYGDTSHWKALQQATKIYALPDTHDIYIEASGDSQARVTKVVKAEVDQLINYIPRFQVAAGMPKITPTVTDPPVAQRVSLTRPLIDFILRALIGLVAGIILAFLFEYLDDTVQDEADVQHWMRVPTLAVIPGGRQARRAARGA